MLPVSLAALVCGASFAAPGLTPTERVAAAVDRTLPVAGLAAPIDVTAVPAAVAAPAGPLFTAAVWSRMAVPDAATLSWLATRVPGLNTGIVRELTAEAIDGVLAEAALRGYSPTDLFSDPGLREDRILLARGAVLSGAFAKYEIPVITLASGNSTDGRAFKMDALVLGAGREEMLYDRADFRIQNPFFSDNEYTLAARVSHGILGPGDMSCEGIVVEMGMIRPRITRFTKISADKIRVETNWGSRDRELRRIVRLP